MLDLIIVIEYDIQISFIYVGSARAVADSWPHWSAHRHWFSLKILQKAKNQTSPLNHTLHCNQLNDMQRIQSSVNAIRTEWKINIRHIRMSQRRSGNFPFQMFVVYGKYTKKVALQRTCQINQSDKNKHAFTCALQHSNFKSRYFIDPHLS